MSVLLDADICIYAINRKRPEILARVRNYRIGGLGISVIIYAELRCGVENSGNVEENLSRLGRFLLPLEVVPFDAEARRRYDRVRTELRRRGCPIGPNDLLIASRALASGATVVTNDVREFSRITGLRVEQWG